MSPRNPVSVEPTARVDALSSDLDGYLRYFENLDLFTGPSVHFHMKTLGVLQQCGNAAAAAAEDRFAEYLYATLTAWGLHRMGKTATKLLSFSDFAGSLREAAPALRGVQNYRLLDLRPEQLHNVVEAVWRLIHQLKLSVSETKLVVNSKALHHLLPELVPPIDREYTLTFFYGHKNLTRGDERTFKEIFPLFHRLGTRCADSIRRNVGRGFSTSETKVIDNAIVGFVAKTLKG